MNPALPELRRLAFVVNATKPGAHELGQRLVSLARAEGRQAEITESYPLPAGWLEGFDVCCTIGGDGTLLSVVNEAVRSQIPVFGINQGRLGFMAILSPEEAEAGLQSILQGRFQLERRSLLHCEGPDGQRGLALNDAVIKSTDGRRLIRLRVRCNGQLVTDYDADGLIFCTPTGSTAYNLSAGGPILGPESEAIVMTPICPHTLSNRSLVFPGNVHLEVEALATQTRPQVTLDGTHRFTGEGKLCLRLRSSSQHLRLLQPQSYDYFSILARKLHWGHRQDS